MNNRAITDVTGVILAGGASSRFGSNKALAELEGRRLIGHPARRLENIFTHLLLVTNSPETYGFLNWPMTGDIFAGKGPLAGIHAALLASSTDRIFVCGCDMPFLEEKLIRYLCAISSGYDVTLPVHENGYEPLCAVYNRSALAHIEKHLRNDIRKIALIIDQLKTRKVKEEELLSITAKTDPFLNINRPQDMPG